LTDRTTQIRDIIDRTMRSGTLLSMWQTQAVTFRHQVGLTPEATAALVRGWNPEQVQDLAHDGLGLLAAAANTDLATVMNYLAEKGFHHVTIEAGSTDQRSGQVLSNDDPPANPITERDISALEGGTRLDLLPWQLRD